MKFAVIAALAIAAAPLSVAAQEPVIIPGGEYMIAYHNGQGVVCPKGEECTFWKDTDMTHMVNVVGYIASATVKNFGATQRAKGDDVPTRAQFEKLLTDSRWPAHFKALYEAAKKLERSSA
ncbi:MAG: hypothetical protein VX730_07120 [Pseudomonadota bacterium]|nr:hypothetical protein [Pseudomonadota bacterium]